MPRPPVIPTASFVIPTASLVIPTASLVIPTASLVIPTVVEGSVPAPRSPQVRPRDTQRHDDLAQSFGRSGSQPDELSRLLGSTILAIVLLAACGDGTQPQSPSPSPSPTVPTTTIAFTTTDGSQAELAVEIADTPEERARGLMFRENLPEDHGMLFVYDAETQAGFWMKDTTIPLSIAFISADDTIIEIIDMQPLDMTLRAPSQPYVTAVEANQGWFERNGITVGAELWLVSSRTTDFIPIDVIIPSTPTAR